MAFFKFSAIVCALFVLQAQAYPQEEVAVNSAIDTIKKIVTALETLVDKALEGGLSLIDKITNLITDLQNHDDKAITDLIAKIGALIDKDMDKFREASNEDAQAAFMCLDQYKGEWRSGEANAIMQLSDCSSTEVTQFLAALKAIVSDLQGAQKDVKSAAEGINQCDGKDDLQTVECLANVAKEVIDVAIRLSDILKSDIKSLVQLFKDNWQSFETCAKATGKDFYTNTIIKVMNNVATCVRH